MDACVHAGEDYPMLTGNLVAIFSSGIICTVISLIKPDSYDWQTTREIPMVDDTDTGALLQFCLLFLPPCLLESRVDLLFRCARHLCKHDLGSLIAESKLC